MKKFIAIYHAPASAMAQAINVPAEQQAEGMKQWMDWAQRTGSHLVDMGAPLMNGVEISPNGSIKASAKNVTGYSILEAENMEQAEKLMEGHPHINGWSKDTTIELHEVRQIPGI